MLNWFLHEKYVLFIYSFIHLYIDQRSRYIIDFARYEEAWFEEV